MTDDALRALPKVELHCHLELTARPALLKELLAAKGRSVSEAEFCRDYLITEPVGDLPTLLNIFLGHRDLLDSAEVVERMTYECCEDMFRNGVRLLELRYAPSFLCDAHDGLKPDAMHAAILKGVERAEQDFPMAVGLICLLQRIKTVEENRYWLDFAVEKKADFLAMDLADNELAFGPAPFIPLFEKAKSEGFAVTIHAGEVEGPQAARNIRDSIELLHADRIGHGVRILEDPSVLDFVRERGTVLELCPTSNWLSGVCATKESHPFRTIMEAGIRTTLNTDDPGIMNIDLLDEYRLLRDGMGFTEPEFVQINQWARDASFIPEARKADVWP
ncbi:MAG: adenosine deaminase [Bacteroidota bacterium]|nr:adenosine deaminase [Bacteroidota bacterium]